MTVAPPLTDRRLTPLIDRDNDTPATRLGYMGSITSTMNYD